MTKADLVDVIADGADLSKIKAEEALNLALDAIKASVAKGNTIQLIGFGSFSLGSRAARMGRTRALGAVGRRVVLEFARRLSCGREMGTQGQAARV